MNALSNSSARDDFFHRMEELGATEGKGKNARASSLVETVYAAADGVIDTLKDHNNQDDAHRAYLAYVKAHSAKAQHDKKTMTAKSSNYRKAIEMGIRFRDDARDVMNRAVEMLGLMAEQEIKTKSPFEAFNSVIRKQLAENAVLTDDQIEAELAAEETKEKNELALLNDAKKSLEKANKLRARPETEEVLKAIDLIMRLHNAEAHAATMKMAA